MTGSETDDSKIWGFDTRFVDGSHPRLAVVNPEDVNSVMSYCSGDPGSQRRWVDRFYHGRFIDSVNGINWDLGPDLRPEGNPPANPLAAFFGYVTSAADGTVTKVSTLPVFTYVATAVPVTTIVGEYRLELLDSVGEVLRAVPFDAQFAVVDAGESGAAQTVSELWAVQVADPPEYASYRIRRGSQQLVQADRSAAAPTVAITAPVAGQVFSGDTVQFSWSGSDTDGDDLSYLVQYSIDGGNSYETVAVGHQSSALSPRPRLAGGIEPGPPSGRGLRRRPISGCEVSSVHSRREPSNGVRALPLDGSDLWRAALDHARGHRLRPRGRKPR